MITIFAYFYVFSIISGTPPSLMDLVHVWFPPTQHLHLIYMVSLLLAFAHLLQSASIMIEIKLATINSCQWQHGCNEHRRRFVQHLDGQSVQVCAFRICIKSVYFDMYVRLIILSLCYFHRHAYALSKFMDDWHMHIKRKNERERAAFYPTFRRVKPTKWLR